MAREKHQNGWVEDSGKRVKKWIGHSGIEFDRKVLWVYDQYGDPTVRTMNCQGAPFSRRGAKHRSAGSKVKPACATCTEGRGSGPAFSINGQAGRGGRTRSSTSEKCSSCERNASGRIKRDPAARREFSGSTPDLIY